MELRKCSSDKAVPVSQRGYVLGTPFDEPFEWTNLQGPACSGMMLDMDPHYAYFGCNTECQVKYIRGLIFDSTS